MSKKHKCPARIYGARWGGHACPNSGKYEHEGVMFCKLHHPPTVKAKREAKYAQWDAEYQAKREAEKQAAAAAAEQKRRAECFPDLLEALQEMLLQHGVRGGDGPSAKARAAIAKATQ